MASARKLSIRIPKPKAKASALRLFPRAPTVNSKKSALQDDPMKYGNFGFDINMQGPGRFGGSS
jgi:hypothetical protein